jgi:hypothetical protein
MTQSKGAKVSFKQCSASKKAKFATSKCIMPISVGIKVHEGTKFSGTMRLINSSFQSCALLIDDSIQKYTMKIETPHLSLDELHIKAVEMGDAWLERNKRFYESLTIPYNIIRWDDWRNHKNFKEFYDRIEMLYNTDDSYKLAIHNNINNFIDGRYLTRSDFNKEHAFDCCLQYLKEECSVMCLWALEQFDFEVYPSGRNEAMTATYEKIIKSSYPGLLKNVCLYFDV